jgi:hypothetical protein
MEFAHINTHIREMSYVKFQKNLPKDLKDMNIYLGM